jgi:hypothetical protein
MRPNLSRAVLIGLMPVLGNAIGRVPAHAQVIMPRLSTDQLVRMPPEAIQQLYRQSAPGTVPIGAVRGVALPRPGSALAPSVSRVARVIWQGKIFDHHSATITNRFFGLRMIKGTVSTGPSWLDGGPATIIDYRGTSLLYAHYRDEIREVAPGLYLGLMYRRRCPQPKLRTYFVLETCP